MKNTIQGIDANYEKFYAQRKHTKLYPTEFAVRTLLAHYPDLRYKRPQAGDSILDIGFGDGAIPRFCMSWA